MYKEGTVLKTATQEKIIFKITILSRQRGNSPQNLDKF